MFPFYKKDTCFKVANQYMYITASCKYNNGSEVHNVH